MTVLQDISEILQDVIQLLQNVVRVVYDCDQEGVGILPSRRPVFSVWDGSFTAGQPPYFRPGSLFLVFGTEVLQLGGLCTSVPEACF